MGSDACRSWRTKTTPAATATAPKATLAGMASSPPVPSDRASSMALTAGTNRPSPVQSNRVRGARSRLRGSSSRDLDCAEQPGGHVDQEEQPPAAERDQQPAHGRAQFQAEGLGGALGADAAAQPP